MRWSSVSFALAIGAAIRTTSRRRKRRTAWSILSPRVTRAGTLPRRAVLVPDREVGVQLFQQLAVEIVGREAVPLADFRVDLGRRLHRLEARPLDQLDVVEPLRGVPRQHPGIVPV